MTTLTFGTQTCGSIEDASAREWLVTDGRGGYAMGTIGGLATRRYHGLLTVASTPPIGRHLALAALDPVLVIHDRRIELATHEWADGTLAPAGHTFLDRFDLIDGVPRWQWSVGPVRLEVELAMEYGNPAVGVRYRMLGTGSDDAIRLEVNALCTWRDVHGERYAYGEPPVEKTADGFTFEGAYRVAGPSFTPVGAWYLGFHHREEAARGLAPNEDLWFAGRFEATLAAGESIEIVAWADDLERTPPTVASLIRDARQRALALAATASAADDVDAMLAHAADQLIVTGTGGPTVVAGYPWFGDWSRDTMTSYEGLFLETGRIEEGRDLLLAARVGVSEGMLANTADAGGTEYNTVDAAMWYLHAVGRHLDRTGDDDLGVELLPTLRSIVDHHVSGTRFGIGVADDGLVTQGADGWALTWMDARVDGAPITARRGKPVEVNALWIQGLGVVAAIAASAGLPADDVSALRTKAMAGFSRFVRGDGGGLVDVLDGTSPDDAGVRPNQLLAVSLPDAPLQDPAMVQTVLDAVEPLLTPLGPRSLPPEADGYLGRHRGDGATRDRAYHQGTVWPWLIGPLVDASVRARTADPSLLAGLEAHLAEFGLGSVSETADGDRPHAATGCPFQAWSVAELLRARRRLGRG